MWGVPVEFQGVVRRVGFGFECGVCGVCCKV